MQLPYEKEQGLPLSELLQQTVLFLWKDWPRDMEAVYHAHRVFTLCGTCPHSDCSRESVFVLATSVASEQASPGVERLIGALRCQGCKQYILGIVTYHQEAQRVWYEAHYPLGTPDDTVADEIPSAIKPDYQEALRCLFVDAYNATAEMCRRAIEASCIDLGAPPKDVLEDMIDWLADQRKITPFLQQVAHKIRLGGNRGAHPPEGGVPPELKVQTANEPILKIEKGHAEAIVTFTREFFHHVYVVPKQLDKYDFSKPKVAKP